MSIVGLSQSRYTQSRQTTSRRTVEASFLGSTKFSSDSYSRRSKEEPALAHQTQSDEGTNSTQTSRKRRCNRGSHLFEAIRAQLRPQALGVEAQPRMSKTLRARLDQSTPITTSEWPSQPPRQQQMEVPTTQAPPDFISRWLDDMLSTSFGPHIISYKLPRGFVVPKFTMYNETNDPFDHIMHFRQLMTLDIGNDTLICKVFPTSLHGQTLSWFHYLSQNFMNTFRDVL